MQNENLRSGRGKDRPEPRDKPDRQSKEPLYEGKSDQKETDSNNEGKYPGDSLTRISKKIKYTKSWKNELKN